MSPGGLLLVLVGVWVGCQVLGGDALGRLKITGAGPTQAQAAAGSIQAPGSPQGNVSPRQVQ